MKLDCFIKHDIYLNYSNKVEFQQSRVLKIKNCQLLLLRVFGVEKGNQADVGVSQTQHNTLIVDCSYVGCPV